MNVELLTFVVSKRLFAVPREHVREVMRPLPIEAVPNVPEFLVGASLIRGLLTPIVDLRKLFCSEPAGAPGRLITAGAGAAQAFGLLVDSVLGLRSLSDTDSQSLPPLLSDAMAGPVQDIMRLDGALLTVLRAARLVPSVVWDELARRGES